MNKAPDELYNLIGHALIEKLSVTLNGEVHAGSVDGLEEVTEAVWTWIQDNYQAIPQMAPFSMMTATEKQSGGIPSG